MSLRPEHAPDGDPCARCGLRAGAHRERRRPQHVPDGDPRCSCGVLAYYHRDTHRPEHPPIGDPCAECGRDADQHRKRGRRHDGRKGRSGPSGPHPHVPANNAPFVGVDGEGQNVGPIVTHPDGTQTREGPHHYTYMAAVDEHGVLRGDLSAAALGQAKLSTMQCLDFLLDLGVNRVFGYSTGYDLTKILTDLPAEMLHKLLRPELRAYVVEGPKGKQQRHYPEHWFGYRLDYMRGRFRVQREVRQFVVKNGKRKRAWVPVGKGLVFWDVWRFFQGSFVSAVEDWKVLSAVELAAMKVMKDDRGAASWTDSEETRKYCRDECEALAKLTRLLVSAHEAKDLRLTQFYGAGSTSKALMTKLGVKAYLAPLLPEMRDAVMRAFVGGRFEFSAVGPVHGLVREKELRSGDDGVFVPVLTEGLGPVRTNDVSGAYPYQLTFLPCLTHGTWTKVRADGPGGPRALERRVANARLACVHARVVAGRQLRGAAFGTLPWRTRKGSILWPLENGGTWVWKDEYLAARRLAPVRPVEAWVYETECDCRPFGQLPEIYAERVLIGKEGPGIVLKLGSNGCYGTLAQSRGFRPPFQSWVYAGCITSGTRAQMLATMEAAQAQGCAPWDVLGFATDAVFSRIALSLPAPRDTQTAELPNEKGQLVKKPLGGWEEKEHGRGVFLCRPGVYFPLAPTEDDLKQKLIKARGMSAKILLKNSARILAHWERHGTRKSVTIEGLRRFVGMTSGVQRHVHPTTKVAGPAVRSEYYGEWVDFPFDLSLEATPKRQELHPDGSRLLPWTSMAGESAPYDPWGEKSPEGQVEALSDDRLADQAEGDFSLA